MIKAPNFDNKYQQGFVPLLALIIVAALAGIGGTAYHYYSSKPAPNLPIQSVTDNQDPAWQEYVNPKYHYKIKYPPDWFFHQTGYGKRR